MCICFILLDAHASLLLLLAFNRDEQYDRPTQPTHFWPDHPHLLAGRDTVGNGTWLGMTRGGRFACVTNWREAKVKHSASSRGSLPTDFLLGRTTPLEYLQDVDQRLEGYSGFNLLVGDLSTLELAYTSNRSPEGPRQLPPGLYGVSNGLLGEWPKVARGTGILQGILAHHAQEQGTCSGTRPEEGGPGMAGSTEAGSTEAGSTESGGSAPQAPGSGPGDAAAAGASNGTSQQQLAGGGTGEQAGREQADATALGGGSGGACGPGAGAAGAAAGNAADAEHALPWDALFEKLMGDRVQHPDQPLTGWGRELDDLLSPIFVEQLPAWEYGTRSQTILAVWRDGHAELRERLRDHDAGGLWREVVHEFQLEGQCSPGEACSADAAAAAAGVSSGGGRSSSSFLV